MAVRKFDDIKIEKEKKNIKVKLTKEEKKIKFIADAMKVRS